MICVTLLTLAFVSSSNVYSEESYIVDTATDAKTQSVDCAMNTADMAKEMSYYWDTDNEKLAAHLKRYNIVSDLDKLDSYNVTQEMLSEDMLP